MKLVTCTHTDSHLRAQLLRGEKSGFHVHNTTRYHVLLFHQAGLRITDAQITEIHQMIRFRIPISDIL